MATTLLHNTAKRFLSRSILFYSRTQPLHTINSYNKHHSTFKQLYLQRNIHSAINSTKFRHSHSSGSSPINSCYGAASMLLCVIGSTTIYILLPTNNNQVYCDDKLSPTETINYNTANIDPNQSFIKSDLTDTSITNNQSLLHRIWSYIYSYLPSFVKPDDVAVLPAAQPDMYGRQPRTLVIGWDSVLVCSEWTRQHGWRMQARNDAAYFLRTAFENGYEIVLWCNQPQHDVEQHTVSPYIGGDIIRHRLYYDNMSMVQFKTVKDLNKLNRDLKRVVVIDSNNKFYWLQPDNCIVIPPFTGSPADRELSQLIPMLNKIQKYNVHDVRNIIHQYNENKDSNLFAIHEQLAQNAKQSLGTYKRDNDDTQSKHKQSSANGLMSRLAAIFSAKPQLPGQKLKLDFNDDDD